ncbi:biotin-dependent enzyme [Breznakibacter xylanolyticus]|uniref:Biotin-dependent enzyme n=1 Tax=Breznakibacter xylanolyticus TaxID=990 RepID=A0A2W7NVW3_9BACT|nr:biotin/lipoyl-containing protein [Breznakibacter xylanolyticus]MBN2742289.1 biotin/lipoyl-binding protein [Marinilabiliaceae bacterium]PZX20744.1 biotin-dependent enzyme [Breznakibacter xylanolyticus]
MEEKKLELVDFVVTARKYKTTLTKKFINRTVYVAPNPDEIKSYIPGTVISIKVKVGQKVKAGETIMIQEAMKMMNQIKMPRDGAIKEILVAEGQRIRKSDLMIVIE